MMKDDDGRDAVTDSTRFAGMAKAADISHPPEIDDHVPPWTVDQGDPRLATNGYTPSITKYNHQPKA